MNRTLKVIALLFCVAALAACGKGNKDLIKSWKIKDMMVDGKTIDQMMQEQMQAGMARMESDSTMPDSAKAKMKSEMETQMAAQKEAAMAGTITFNADGTCSMMMGGNTQSGKWEMADKKLKITDANGKAEDWTIETLSENSLVMSGNMDGKPAKLTLEPAAAAAGSANTGSSNAGH